MKRIKRLASTIEPWDGFEAEVNESLEMAELVEADDPEGESSDAQQLATSVEDLQHRYDALQLKLMLNGENDGANAFLHINAGAGGTDATDWVAMLLRMYTRWCEQRGYSIDTLELHPAEEAGLKSVTLHVKGDDAYGYLKSEVGVHRLVRISPFNSQGKRQTSFAAVYADPEVEDDGEIEVNPADLRIDTYRASGAGGQHVNKTESAVRITHLPTNTVVQCQNERSQIKNRATAMKMLRARLAKLKEMERDAEKAEKEAGKADIGFGNQIRNYVLHPYSMVKDVRTQHETSNTQGVLDGDLDPFINEYLKSTMGSASAV